MRAIICGGRTYTMTPYDWKRIDAIHESRPSEVPPEMAGAALPTGPIECVYEGEADGADLCGRAWAESRGVPWLGFPADWHPGGGPLDRGAGPKRNADMRDGRHSSGQVQPPELVIAASGGSGTADMVSKMRAAGRHVYELREPWQRWGRGDAEALRDGMDRYLARWMELGSGGPAIISAHALKVGSRVVVPGDIPVVYCGRGSLAGPGGARLPGSGLLGNPLKIETKRDDLYLVLARDGTHRELDAEELLEAYRVHLRKLFRADERVRDMLLTMKPWTLLVCWCPESSPCHATVIADAAMQAQAAADICRRGLATPARHWCEYSTRSNKLTQKT